MLNLPLWAIGVSISQSSLFQLYHFLVQATALLDAGGKRACGFYELWPSDKDFGHSEIQKEMKGFNPFSCHDIKKKSKKKKEKKKRKIHNNFVGLAKFCKIVWVGNYLINTFE